MSELELCPFCGGKAEIVTWKRARTIMTGCLTDRCIVKKLHSKYLVKCSNKKCCACRPQTKYFYTKKKAIEAWNRRVGNDKSR